MADAPGPAALGGVSSGVFAGAVAAVVLSVGAAAAFALLDAGGRNAASAPIQSALAFPGREHAVSRGIGKGLTPLVALAAFALAAPAAAPVAAGALLALALSLYALVFGLDAALRIALDGPREGGERTDPGQVTGVADGVRDGAKRSDASGGELGGLALIGVGPDSSTFALLMNADAAPSVEPTDVLPMTVPDAVRDDTGEFAAPDLTLNQSAELAGVALTAGVLWWAIYGGATVWLLIATGPVARTFDPLPILARDDVDLPHDEADELFDGGTGLDGDTTGRRAAGSRRTPVAAWMSS
jgi:hypothetical protein